MEQTIKSSTVVKSSAWKIMESYLSKGISMIVSIVLARLIAPDAYGVIALTTVFINLTDILIQAGFSTTLIRKEHVTAEDYSTVLGISLISSVILYLAIFLLAPVIAIAYDTPLLSSVLRVIALLLFCQAFSAVRTAAITREMKFNTLFKCTIISNILSGVIGIVLAYIGLEVWALVVHHLCQQILLTILLFLNVKMKYHFRISKKSIQEIVPPSLRVLSSSLLSFAGDSLYSAAVGKVYSMEELGYTDKGSLFPRSFSLYTFGAISSVFLPVFAAYQNDLNKLNEIFRRVLNVVSFIIIPMMAGLSMVAEPLISVVLTDKWLPALNIFRWNCLYYLATPIMLANVQLHFAIGKNETRIKTEIVRIVLMIILFIIMIFTKASLTSVTAALAVIQILIVTLIMRETNRATGYKIFDTICDIFPSIISAVLMCLSIWAVGQVKLSNILLLGLEIITGGLVYWSTSVIFRNRAYGECLNMVKTLLRIKKEKQ